jgi:hypothetical protein
VYAIESIDDAIELLTGMAAGTRDDDGRFPEGTVNRLTEDRLVEFARRRRRFAESNGDAKE